MLCWHAMAAVPRFAICLLFVSGCQWVLGMEDSTLRSAGSGAGGHGAGGADAGSGGDSPPGDCDDHELCIALPLGWSGPIEIRQSNEPLSCGEADSTVLGGHDSLPVQSAVCDPCSCDPPTGDCSAIVSIHSTGICSIGNGSGSGRDCVDLAGHSSANPSNSALVSTMGAPGSCAAMGGGATRPPVEFQTAYRSCELAIGAACPGGTCVAASSALWWGPCIYQAGDVDCDVPAFPEKLVLETVASDERDCTPCSCDQPQSCDDFTVVLFANLGCAGAQQHITPQSTTCITLSGADVSAFNFTPSCASDGGDPTGSVTFETTTVCCVA